jgi:hypothetical protein
MMTFRYDLVEKESTHMKQSALRKRVIGFTVLGLSVVAVPAVAMASSPSSSPTATTVKATTTTTPAKTPPPTTAKATTATITPKATAPKAAKTYEVIAGTFTTRAAAQKRLTAINKNKKIVGLTIVTIGKTHIKYRLEETGLTKAKAIAAVKVLKTGKFFAYYVVH